jgi:hypothetical protein
MDADLIGALRRIAGTLLLSGAHGAHALGPAAPFTPPGAASAVAAEQIAPLAPATTGLGGVRLGAPPQALIDGQWHRGGTAVRGAVLHTITRHGVTLRHPDGRTEHLWLLPRPTTSEQAKP